MENDYKHNLFVWKTVYILETTYETQLGIPSLAAKNCYWDMAP